MCCVDVLMYACIFVANNWIELNGVVLPWTTGTLHGTPVSACSPLGDAMHAKTLQWGSLPYSQSQSMGRIDF